MDLDWRCISYWKWGYSSQLLQRWKIYQLPSSRFVWPRYRKPMFALAPWQRETFTGWPRHPPKSCGVLEIGLTFWDVFGMMLKLPPDTGTHVPDRFSSCMCPSETCWLFLSSSDHLQAMYHLSMIVFDHMFFFQHCLCTFAVHSTIQP